MKIENAENELKQILEYLTKEDKAMGLESESPNYYKKDGIECIQAIRAIMTEDEYKGYLRGNVFKYIWRYKEKGGVKDLGKAKVYLAWLIDEEMTPTSKQVETKKSEPKRKDGAERKIGLQEAVDNYNLASGSGNDPSELADILCAIERDEGEVLLYKGFKKDEGDDFYDEYDLWYPAVVAKVVKLSDNRK